MPTYSDVVRDGSGYDRPVVAGAQVYLLKADSTLAAADQNPVATDDYGVFTFTSVPDGKYFREVRVGGVAYARDSVIVGNPPEYIGPAGPSNNTRPSLAALKAANTGDGTSLYDGALWTWTLGNYSGLADDVNIVKANSTALSVGAWVRQTAGGVAYGSTNVGAALTQQSVKLARTVYVTDPPYNAVGDGVTDDSAAIMACINANKGQTIVFPQGKTYLAAGTALSGSTYNGTTLRIEGTYKMKPSGGAANFGGASPFFGGIIVHDCDGVTVDVPGMIDGNRLAQTQWQQHHAIVFWGATNFAAPRVNARELRGDAVYISSKTNISPLTKNSYSGIIGTIVATNSDYDGRNALSIVSGENISVGFVLSAKVGGVINNERMPGGVDIEPDGAWHLVKRIRIASAVVDSVGTSGMAVIGHSMSENDGAEDWNCQDVQFDDFSVYNPIATSVNGSTGGPIFRRAINLKVSGSYTMGQPSTGFTFDYLRGLVADVRANGVARGAIFGVTGTVRDFDAKVNVLSHTGAAVQTTGVQDGTLQITTRNPQGAGSYGLQLANLGRTITQTNVKYDVDIPYSPNLSGAVLISSVTIGEGTYLKGSMTGYTGGGSGLQFLGGVIPTKLVEGRNFRTVLPTAGLWLQREQIWYIAPAAGQPPGAICVQSGDFANTPPVFKAMASVAA